MQGAGNEVVVEEEEVAEVLEAMEAATQGEEAVEDETQTEKVMQEAYQVEVEVKMIMVEEQQEQRTSDQMVPQNSPGSGPVGSQKQVKKAGPADQHEDYQALQKNALIQEADGDPSHEHPINYLEMDTQVY